MVSNQKLKTLIEIPIEEQEEFKELIKEYRDK